MFSINANIMYSFDEKGNHSLEISYNDSNGTNVGAYAEGDALDKVLLDVMDQLDEAIAEFDDDQADKEEMESLQAQIADVQAQLEALEARNKELQDRQAKKRVVDDIKETIPATHEIDKDIQNMVSNFYKKLNPTEEKNKATNFPFTPGWWV